MALSANVKLVERFAPGEFAYPVASGSHVYLGALVALTAANTLVPMGNANAVAFAGIADVERDNTLGTDTRAVRCRKGTWAITVPNATPAAIGAPVYAVDDGTVSLANPAVAVAAGANTGNGGFGTTATAGAGVVAGPYTLTMTSATAFTLTDPNGDAMPVGTVGTAYSNRALSFTLSAGGTAFVAGDKFTLTVTQTSGAVAIGTLAGIEAGQTFVKLS